MSAIHCDGLTKRFGNLKAVDGIGFDMAAGEICAILGPNGAGKSTLIAMLSGLVKPDFGSVRVAGYEPRTSSGGELESCPIISHCCQSSRLKSIWRCPAPSTVLIDLSRGGDRKICCGFSDFMKNAEHSRASVRTECARRLPLPWRCCITRLS